jgi:hypothetical protein
MKIPSHTKYRDAFCFSQSLRHFIVAHDRSRSDPDHFNFVFQQIKKQLPILRSLTYLSVPSLLQDLLAHLRSVVLVRLFIPHQTILERLSEQSNQFWG